MKEANSNSRLIIVLNEHPVLGMLLTPFIVEEKRETEELVLIEQAYHLSESVIEELNTAEQKAIKIAQHYTERHLMGLFSKEKTTARFLKRISEKSDELKRVRAFIEEHLLQMIHLVREVSLPIYQKPNGSKVLYAHHLFNFHPDAVDISFKFKYHNERLNYRFDCSCDDKMVNLAHEKPAIAITTTPLTLALGMNIYIFNHIPANLLMPLTKKDFIDIQTPSVDKYIDNILIPIARYHDVITAGFLFEEVHYPCQPILYFEEESSDIQLLQLNFQYDKHRYPIQAKEVSERYIFSEDREGDKYTYYFYRDKAKEQQTIDLLIDNGLVQTRHSHFKLSKEAPESNLVEWISRHRQLIESVFEFNSKAINANYCSDDIFIEQSYDKTPDWFELNITVVIGQYRIPFQRFRNHILNSNREFILPDGRFVLLPEEWFSRYRGLFAFTRANEKTLRLKPAYIGVIQTLLNDNDAPKEFSPIATQKYNTPKGLKATLRPYQLKGYQWLMNLYDRNMGGCLADDMGLGKTLQTLAFLERVHHGKPKSKQHKTTLLVMPTSLTHNWKNEIRRFSTLSFWEMSSYQKVNEEQLADKLEQHDLIIISYGMIRKNIGLLENYPFECIILDESQNIKNSDSITFRAVSRLQSPHRFVLTGTPIENSLNDLWAQFNFIMPSLLGSEPSFNKRFIVPIKNGDEQTQLLLRQFISPFILRRTKQEVAPDLPPLTERIVYCPMTEMQRELYDKEKNSLRNILLEMTDDNKQERFTILNGLTRLRQLACHPRLIDEEYSDISGKMEQIMSLYETLQSEGHKVLIFSAFVKHLEIIATEFNNRGWKYAWLTGSTHKRAEEIDLFAKADEVQAFFISLKAGGVGLNLVKASYVFIIDPWWNPAAEAQAIARSHRIGQQKKVIAYRFITERSIEEKIMRLQDEKRRMANTMIDENRSMSNLSNQEWYELLK